MHSFRTTLPPFNPHFQIQHTNSLMCIGSCFAENMSKRLSAAKFTTLVNPFGILYHPLHIANCLDMISQDYVFGAEDLIQSQDRWYSHWHHSQFSHQDQSQLILNLQNALAEAKPALAGTEIFIFTFGTAYCYEHNDTGINVANCHKIPANQFTKKKSSVEEILLRYKISLDSILELNPAAKFIFTVSPIRHLKDGIIENTSSKAILHLAVDALVKDYEQAYYFPSYELMMDDLRDYRFYKEDLLHPSEVAVQYIWAHFTAHLFSQDTQQLMSKIDAIQQATHHKAFHPKSEAHQQFLKTNLKKIAILKKENPKFDFSKEEDFFNENIITQKN